MKKATKKLLEEKNKLQERLDMEIQHINKFSEEEIGTETIDEDKLKIP